MSFPFPSSTFDKQIARNRLAELRDGKNPNHANALADLLEIFGRNPTLTPEELGMEPAATVDELNSYKRAATPDSTAQFFELSNNRRK
jgi:hypothetical protein